MPVGEGIVARSALARRLLGLCVVAGLLMGLTPIAIHAYVSHQQLSARAADHAHGLAAALGRLAARQPALWQYNAAKVTRAASNHPGREQLEHVRVVDCGGRSLFSRRQLGVVSQGLAGPVARAGIRRHGRVVGIVEVGVDATDTVTQLGLVGATSLVLGAALAMLLFLIPARRIAEAEAAASQRRLADGVINSQESERRRIAADLHDGVGQHLSAARVAIELGRHDAALSSTDDALAELRHAVFNIRPRELDEAGPVAAIQAAVRRLEQRAGIHTTFEHDGAGIVDVTAGTALLRIAQEALGNAARHAGASRIDVTLSVTSRRVTLTVCDNGGGIDPNRPGDGVGLLGMRERAQLLGGDVGIGPSAGGTRVVAWIPVAHHDL